MNQIQTSPIVDIGSASDAPTETLHLLAETLHLLVDNVHCAGCIKRIEGRLGEMPGVAGARVNLSTKRLRVQWRPGQVTTDGIIDAVTQLGFPARAFDPSKVENNDSLEDKHLLKAMAVAGFAAANVMLLSVSVWSGHFSGMDGATRDLFHWLSALIALPAVAYAGRPFFYSAARALKGRALNMDVPISLAVVLAAGMSLQQTMKGAEHAYFDASVTLLFFLLVGRFLDRRARTKARSAAARLLSLRAATARIVGPDGGLIDIDTDDLNVGHVLVAATGERLAADGIITVGETELDTSLISGESVPQSAGPGAYIHAGAINMGPPIQVRVTAVGEATLLAEIVRLMEAAEQGRAKYVRLADRAARIYAPAVHILAGAAFAGWMIAGAGWEKSLLVAVAVLIITCPCALGLAVPTVQVVASGQLLRRGILLKSADGLERLAAVDHVVFDKTGTLTLGEPALVETGDISDEDLAIAMSLATHSRHPLARALVRAYPGTATVPLNSVEEQPGQGLVAVAQGRAVRLGNRRWCGIDDIPSATSVGPEIWLAIDGAPLHRLQFQDQVRADARATIERLKQLGLSVELLSGDREDVVGRVAEELSITDWQAEATPDAKVRRLKELAASGRKVLMVGDGLNDAPALAQGHASISPATAADISQTAADFVFQGTALAPVADAIVLARAATRHVVQNFGLALTYNLIAVPIALAGLATPLVAAIAMSSSSILVTLNALRLKLVR